VPQKLYPTLRAQDAGALIRWLQDALGLEERVVYRDGEAVVHAELGHGEDIVMLGSVRHGASAFQDAAPPAGSGSVYLAVEDADALFARATAAGAEVVVDLHDTDYGSRDFTVRDPEGNLWSVGTYGPRPQDPPLPG
jgi:uncharacterized glyoxalase superfamily protein PhnB